MMRKREAVNKIKVLLKAQPHWTLPPVRQLACLLSCSPTTAWKALQLLREEGLYFNGPAGSIQKAKSDKPILPPRRLSAQALASVLSRRIHEGQFRTGDPLPKVYAICREHRVSSRSVVACLKQLADDGLIHKQGKAWIAGRWPGNSQTPGSNGPYIIVLELNEDSWKGLHNERSGPFYTAFEQEALRNSVQLKHAFAANRLFLKNGLYGVRDIARTIIKNRDTYLGTLITFRNNVQPIKEYTEQLLRFPAPVVWFDEQNSNDPITFPGRFFRFHFNEESGCEAVLNHLKIHNHRNVVYLNLRQNKWAGTRFSILEEVAHKKYKHMTLQYYGIPIVHDEECVVQHYRNLAGYFAHTGFSLFRNLIPSITAYCTELKRLLRQDRCYKPNIPTLARDLFGKASPQQALFWSSMFLYTKPFQEILANESITAAIIPNDEEGRYAYYWLNQMSVTPRHLSLVSFDNHSLLHPCAIDSVDFGFAGLGYRAFHVMYGDLSASIQISSDIPATATVVQRGSTSHI